MMKLAEIEEGDSIKMPSLWSTAVCILLMFNYRLHCSASECNVKQDLAFVIDASSSICNGGDSSNRSPPPCPNWFDCLEFVHDLVQSMTVGPNDTRIACIVFYNYAEVRFKFNTYETQNKVLEAIDDLHYSTGGTYTALALKFLLKKVFTQKAGDRADASDTVIVITDGQPSIEVDTTSEAIQMVHDRGIRVLAIGVGNSVEADFIKELSTYPQKENVTYFLAKNYNTLKGVREALMNITCEPIKISESEMSFGSLSSVDQLSTNHSYEDHSFAKQSYRKHSFTNLSYETHSFANQSFVNQSFVNQSLANACEDHHCHGTRVDLLLLGVTMFAATLICSAVVFVISLQLILIFVASNSFH